jgi:hypothetical protein
MKIAFRGGGRNPSDAFRGYAARRLLFALTRFGLKAVTVRFDKPRSHGLGPGVHCRLDVEFTSSRAVAAEVFDTEQQVAFDRALERVRRGASRLAEPLPAGGVMGVPVNGRVSALRRQHSGPAR